MLAVEFAFFDTYTIYFFQTFTTIITGNLILMVVGLPTDIISSLLILLQIVVYIVGITCSSLLSNHYFHKKEQSLFVICIIAIIMAITQLVFIKSNCTGYQEYLQQTSAFAAGLKFSWSLAYSGVTLLGQTGNIIKLFTELIKQKYNSPVDKLKARSELFLYVAAIVFFIIGTFMGLFFCYIIGYYAILIIVIFNVIQLFVYAESVCTMRQIICCFKYKTEDTTQNNSAILNKKDNENNTENNNIATNINTLNTSQLDENINNTTNNNINSINSNILLNGTESPFH